MLGIGDVDNLITGLKQEEGWQQLQHEFNDADCIVYVGHGGNLAIADHIAIDTVRLTKSKKTTFSPGSAILATSLINDSNFEEWLVDWFKPLSNILNKSKTLIIGISSSGKSTDSLKLIEYCHKQNFKNALITAKENSNLPSSTIVINTKCNSYHKSEVIALSIGYQLILDAGFECPPIK